MTLRQAIARVTRGTANPYLLRRVAESRRTTSRLLARLASSWDDGTRALAKANLEGRAS